MVDSVIPVTSLISFYTVTAFLDSTVKHFKLNVNI